MNTTRPAEIAAARAADERIAAAWDAYWTAMVPVKRYDDHLRDLRRRERTARAAETKAAWGERIATVEAERDALVTAARLLATAAHELDAELYTGWQRFFKVEHIHRSTSCSSFRPTTRVGWLPNLSGLTEAEAVAEHGAILCTICFPSAPVEYTRGAADNRCPGSGQTIHNGLPNRSGFYSGNWSTCAECGKRVSVTSRGLVIPKHTPEAAK